MMTPFTPEERLNTVERELSGLHQQIGDITKDVEVLLPVRDSVIRIEETIKHIEKDVGSLGQLIRTDREEAVKVSTELSKELRDMRDESAAQSKANKTQLWAGVISIITTLMIVGGTIIASGVA